MKIKKTFSLINTLLFLFLAKISNAQSLINPNDPKYKSGNYQLNDFVVLIIEISDLILRFIGSLALLFFIYGGLMFLLSSGSSDQVSKAKGIIKAAVVGLILVFAGFLIIQLVLSALGIEGWEGSFINIKT